MTPAIHFRPNCYGERDFHLGNAKVGYDSWRWSQRLGVRFVVRLDDICLLASQYQFADHIRAEGEAQIMRFLDAIGAKPDAIFHASERFAMYNNVMKAFLASKQAKDWTRCFEGVRINDWLRGCISVPTDWATVFNQNVAGHGSMLMPTGWIHSVWNACDYIYDRIPLHIRGCQIWPQSFKDMVMLKKFREWLGPFPGGYEGPSFIHIPMLSANKKLLNKTRIREEQDAMAPWVFDNWVKQFNTQRELYLALDKLSQHWQTGKESTSLSMPLNDKGEPTRPFELAKTWNPVIGLQKHVLTPFGTEQYAEGHVGGALPETPIDDEETKFWKRKMKGRKHV